MSPQLRFPQFEDGSTWEIKSLRSIATLIRSRNKKHEVQRVLSNSAEYGVIDQRDYFDRDIANSDNIDGYFIVEADDFVYNPRISSLAPVGPISRNRVGRGVMSPLYSVFRFEQGLPEFFEQYFMSTAWHDYMRRVSNNGARHDRMAVTTDDFLGLPVPFPPLPEQKKVADFL